MTKRRRVFAGIRCTGRQHIGNYMGAIQNFVALQEDYDCVYSAVDIHTITTPWEPSELRENVWETVLDLLAAGIEPERSILYVQSHVPEVMELAMFLGMITPLGWLTRVTTFKDKVRLHPENVNYGLVGYPVLMTADIILYKATTVPVGEDQQPHLELAREIARRFNRLFGKMFPEPHAKLTEAPVVLGLDGVNKMSKSLDNHIELAATPEETERRVMTAVTDPQRTHRHIPGRPEVCNVYSLHQHFNPDDVAVVYEECTTAKRGCVECKQQLAEGINRFLAPFRQRRQELAARPEYVKQVLADGAARARAIAGQTIAEAREKMGLPAPYDD
ncbi:MAG: tryptophan--tRNA ligase [Dehalococcoidia bacterium SM23_28_2]|nr:MAG: tryptophan--tRNA ligase [Dehalococcoidia bacterium SM23_28_2]